MFEPNSFATKINRRDWTPPLIKRLLSIEHGFCVAYSWNSQKYRKVVVNNTTYNKRFLPDHQPNCDQAFREKKSAAHSHTLHQSLNKKKKRREHLNSKIQFDAQAAQRVTNESTLITHCNFHLYMPNTCATVYNNNIATVLRQERKKNRVVEVISKNSPVRNTHRRQLGYRPILLIPLTN